MDVTFLKMDIWMEIWNAFLKGKMETKHVPNLIVFYLFALYYNASYYLNTFPVTSPTAPLNLSV
jgi:hypothetical protein